MIRFNFSVRNGKRWSPYAVITLVSSVPPFAFRFRFSLLFGFLLPLFLLLIKLSLLFGSDGVAVQSDPAGENTAETSVSRFISGSDPVQDLLFAALLLTECPGN